MSNTPDTGSLPSDSYSRPHVLGEPTAEYPWAFGGYLEIAGQTADRIDVTERMRAELAVSVGEVFQHCIRFPSVRVREHGRRSMISGERILRIGIQKCCRIWVHGDHYSRHLILDNAAHRSGVIDWDDAHTGDPVLDLAIANSFLPVGRRIFRQACGPGPDLDTWERARFRALHYALLLLKYGAFTRDAAMEHAGRTALRLALQD